MLLALYLIYKRLNLKQSLSFLVAVLYINPISTAFSPHYGSDYIIALLAVISLLIQQPKIRVWKTFLTIGITTAYFDLLTAPLITLGVPLIIQTLLQKKTLKEDLKKIITYSSAWLYGYFGMWLMKWLIATVLTNENIIKDGLTNILYRTFGKGNLEITLIDWRFSNALKNNLAEFYYTPSALIILVYFLLLCLSYFFKKYKITKDYHTILLIFISTYPFLWFAILINHSIIHPLLTYRILSITIYAITASIAVCLQPITPSKKRKKLINNQKNSSNISNLF